MTHPHALCLPRSELYRQATKSSNVLFPPERPNAVAEGRIEQTQANIFSADETADVGIDNQTPVAEGIGIGPETRFTGQINKIILEVDTVKLGAR